MIGHSALGRTEDIVKSSTDGYSRNPKNPRYQAAATEQITSFDALLPYFLIRRRDQSRCNGAPLIKLQPVTKQAMCVGL